MFVGLVEEGQEKAYVEHKRRHRPISVQYFLRYSHVLFFRLVTLIVCFCSGYQLHFKPELIQSENTGIRCVRRETHTNYAGGTFDVTNAANALPYSASCQMLMSCDTRCSLTRSPFIIR